MRLGLAGTGRIGTAHAETLKGFEEVESVVVADVDTARAASAAAKLGVESTSLEELFSAGLGVVSLLPATPPAARHRLPTIYEWREIVEAGGLMSYGPSLADVNGRVAVYVDKILKGANPGSLPVERPSKLELALNLKTAGALGLKIPSAVIARPDRVVR